MTDVVVDTSIAIKWVLTEVQTLEARALLADWLHGGRRPLVPSWFACEMANALYQKFLQDLVTLEDAQRGLEAILATVAVHDFEPRVATRALSLAQRFRQRAAYDVQYLALAELLDCELWTADRRFWLAINAAHPRVRWLGEVAAP